MKKHTHSEPTFTLSFLAPKFWGTWALLALMRASTFLPFRCSIFLGKYLGRGLVQIMSKRKLITTNNLKLCFPEHSDLEIQKLAQQSYENAGISIFETALAWWASDKRIQKFVSIEGQENLNKALQNKESVLLLSGHFSSLEMGARILSIICDYQAMYKPAKNLLYNYFMYHGRKRHFAIVKHKDTKTFIKNLKNGLPSWYAPDQNLKFEDHVFVDFFKVPTLSITATSRIAKITKAKVMPYYPIRQGAKYNIIFKESLVSFPSDNIEQDITTVNQTIEAGIRIAPSQYLWGHKRFDELPNGTRREYS